MIEIANLICGNCGSHVSTDTAESSDDNIASVLVGIAFVCETCGVIKAEDVRLKPVPSEN